MQTGVKSFGWENNTAQELPIQSWNWILPSVVSASKSGAVSPILSVMCASLQRGTHSNVPASTRHLNGSSERDCPGLIARARRP